MSYMQKRFSQNICRICKKTLCCKKCRLKHEENVHNIFPNCDICLYGRTYSSKVLQVPALVQHIRKQHWPLHCLYCKHSYSSINELIDHNKCTVGPPKMEITNTKTPIRPITIICSEYVDSNFNSPPIGILINSEDITNIFGTSTPTQEGEIGHEIFPETITPVDNTERKEEVKSANENLSIPFSNEGIQKNKRRVTFNETPQSEDAQRFNKSHGIEGMFKKCEPQKLCLKEDSSIIVENDDEALEKVNNEAMSVELSDNKENSLKDKPAVIKKRRSSGTGDTVWQSAIESQLQVDEEEDESFKSNLPEMCNIMKKEGDENSPSFSYVSESQYSVVSNSSYMSGHSLGDCSDIEKTGGLWSSMAFLVKSVVKGFGKGGGNESINSNKRQLSDSETIDIDSDRKLKRIKLTEIKCRPPIRNTMKYKLVKRSVKKVDKATQTEDEIYTKG